MTFADNVGADVTMVFSGNLTLASAATGGTPRDFDIIIPLTTPCKVNAAMEKNVLLDVKIPTCVLLTAFDAVFEDSNDKVSRAYTYTTGNAESLAADFQDTVGLVTQFTQASRTRVASAPALSPVACAGLGVLLIGVGVRSMRRRTTG